MTEIKFDPQESERRLRAENPEYSEARRRQDEEKQKYLEPIIQYFSKLEDEVINMPISSRFRTDKKPDFARGLTSEMNIMPWLTELSEAEYKRAQLKDDISQARQRAMALIGAIEVIVMDIEATKRD